MAAEKYNPAQITARIRFELEQMRARNEQHGFEHLCRHLARALICRNILPATGPVAAGGDQGRDFETFRTYLAGSPIADSSFVGRTSEGPVAFACTLTDKKNIVGKMKSDIKTITASGEPVVDIHYFCTADVPVSRRHELQEWAKDNHNVPLEIHDGQAISEHLACRDLFWIAVQYSNIPSDLYPPAPSGSEDEWYQNLLSKWKDSAQPPDNYADFIQIKSASRHATHSDTAKQDLPFWIGCLDSLIQSTPLTVLQRKAMYEIAVAALIGLGTLYGYEEKLRLYFADIPSLSNLSDIEDITALWTYCVGAYNRNLVQFTSEELTRWREQIIGKIEGELHDTEEPGRRCALLHDLGCIYVIRALEQGALPDVDAALTYWLELSSIADKAYFFPLDNFADHLTQLLNLAPDIASISDNPKFYKLAQRIDELLSKRHGEFIAAEKCRDRAIALYNKGEILRALKEIHMAKIKWFAEETLRGSVLAASFASRCYQDIGLAFAAKYYALASAHICVMSSNEEVKQYIPRALVDAAACDYLQGAFCGFFDLSDIALRAFRVFANMDSSDADNEINRTVFHASVIYALSKHLATDLTDFVNKRISVWEGLQEYFEQIIPVAESVWKGKTLSQLWSTLEEQLVGSPFSDVGQERTVSFQALGVTWFFHWDNTYDVTCMAEELISALQILLADLAGSDLCLLRTSLDAEFQADTVPEIIVEPIPSNEQACWKIRIPSTSNKDLTHIEVVALATKLLTSVSVLPADQLYNHLDDALREGLSNKTLFGQRYKVLYMEVVTKDTFESSGRKYESPPQIDRPFRPIVHQQLDWYDKLIPGYSKESAEALLGNRYKHSVIPIKYTLGRLLQDPGFKETTNKLKGEGWLDWHILTAVALATVNYRVAKKLGLGRDIKDYTSHFDTLFHQEEGSDLPLVPMSEYSEDKLRLHLHASMISTLRGLGFVTYQQTPDFKAISDFLGKRCNYWIDDIPHLDYGF